MFDYFDFHGHICISFEILGTSVFEFMVCLHSLSMDFFHSTFFLQKNNNFTPYPMNQIKEIGYQLIHSVKSELFPVLHLCILAKLTFISLCFFFQPVLHSNFISHTDLKPENMLFENSNYEITYEKVSRIDILCFMHL